MSQQKSDPETFGLMAQPSNQVVEAIRAIQQAEHSLLLRHRAKADPEAGRERERSNTDSNAAYARHLGRNGHEAGRQEERLKDARAWAAPELRELVPRVQDVLELKERVVKNAWDKFVPKDRDRFEFLHYREFASALWEEGWSSLEDLAIEAIQEHAPSDVVKGGLASGFKAGVLRTFGGLWSDRQQSDAPRWLTAMVDEVSFPDLPPDVRTKIKAQLLKAAAGCWKSSQLSASPECMRQAFHAIAQVLFDAQILKADLLSEISLLVWESAVAGGWFCITWIRRETGVRKVPGCPVGAVLTYVL
jgi:hypothetical protein